MTARKLELLPGAARLSAEHAYCADHQKLCHSPVQLQPVRLGGSW